MSNNIGAMTKVTLTTSIFADSILDQLVFNTKVNRVFIFTVNLASDISCISQSTYWKCLSVEEKIQANNYHTKSLSDKYVISHGILRHILGYYTKQYPQDVKFIHNQYGKPFLKNSSNIHFNMSHSRNMVSYIIALNYMVGIDIEMHDNNLNVLALADLVLTPEEFRYLSGVDSKEKLELFYHLWTKKESLVKANGKGLTYPINTIEAMSLVSGKAIFLTNEKNTLQQEQEWYYYELETPENYSGAIAIANKISEIVYLEMNNQQNIFDHIRLKCLS